MPKRKSPYKARKYNEFSWHVVWGKAPYVKKGHYWQFPSAIEAEHVAFIMNEAYAHGYRNGMRAGRKG